MLVTNLKIECFVLQNCVPLNSELMNYKGSVILTYSVNLDNFWFLV